MNLTFPRRSHHGNTAATLGRVQTPHPLTRLPCYHHDSRRGQHAKARSFRHGAPLQSSTAGIATSHMHAFHSRRCIKQQQPGGAWNSAKSGRTDIAA